MSRGGVPLGPLPVNGWPPRDEPETADRVSPSTAGDRAADQAGRALGAAIEVAQMVLMLDVRLLGERPTTSSDVEGRDEPSLKEPDEAGLLVRLTWRAEATEVVLRETAERLQRLLKEIP